MATLIELNLAIQTINNLAGLQRDMVTNATVHKAMLAGGAQLAPVLEAGRACAAAYQKRLSWVSAVTGNAGKLTTLTNGLTALGATVGNANASVTVLLSAANALATAMQSATTGADVNAACDALLASVPAPVVLF